MEEYQVGKSGCGPNYLGEKIKIKKMWWGRISIYTPVYLQQNNLNRICLYIWSFRIATNLEFWICCWLRSGPWSTPPTRPALCSVWTRLSWPRGPVDPNPEIHPDPWTRTTTRQWAKPWRSPEYSFIPRARMWRVQKCSQ